MAKFRTLTHTAPVLITLQEFKTQLQFDDPAAAHDEDSLLQIYIDAAIKQAEQKTNSAISEVKYQVFGDSFADVLKFKNQLVKEDSVAITYKPTSYTTGNLDTLSTDLWSLDQVDDFERRIVFEDDLPEVLPNNSEAVQVELITGYTADTLPQDIKVAVMLYASDMYNNRTDVPKEKHSAADKLLAPYKYYPTVD